ncbi:MAG: prolipoprotein diacylglyceryl transferase [Rhodospirillales bacterium]|nr:prolipoprotein diacylglyceryl transferase [Rhodospirillales bacterium]
MTFVIPYPSVDPELIRLGPLVIRWYSLAYIAGLLIAWRYLWFLAKRPPGAASKTDIDDFLVWATLGVILGGRAGHVLFYGGTYYLYNPLAILRVWEGGMSFHGGLLGVAAAEIWFCRKRRIKLLPLADIVACAAPIGLFLGRLANFINGELYGRVSDVSWAMVFPHGGLAPRHPSQLYEAGLEGVALFVILYLLWRRQSLRSRPGFLAGAFLAGYGAFRSFAEFFREPGDGYVGVLTAGQALSVPMVLLGLYLVFRSFRRETAK